MATIRLLLDYLSPSTTLTTPAPTTAPPTTLGPTTVSPTTVLPTTLLSTTLPPTTLLSTTLAPTTLSPTTLIPGNNFASDPHCVGWYRFEYGAVNKDSKGLNDLTQSSNPVTASTTHKEGSYSGDFENGSFNMLSRLDSALSSNFPCKSGQFNRSFSISLWFRLETIPSGYSRHLVSKYDEYAGERSFDLIVTSRTLRFHLYSPLGYQNIAISNLQQIVFNRWYHAALSYSHLTGLFYAEFWDSVDLTLVTTGPLSIGFPYSSSARFTLGNVYNGSNPPVSEFFDGLMDEVVIFNDALSASEMEDIRNGEYLPLSSTTLPPTSWIVPTTIISTTLAPTTPFPGDYEIKQLNSFMSNSFRLSSTLFNTLSMSSTINRRLDLDGNV